MAGRTKVHIRPKQRRCPADGSLFSGAPPRCPTCGRIPEGRYQLDWWYRGEQFRPETSRSDGSPLDSWGRALQEASEITTLLRRKRFDPALFRVHSKSEYLLGTRYASWIAKLERRVQEGKRSPGYLRLVRAYWNAHLSRWKTEDVRDLTKAKLQDIQDELMGKGLAAKTVSNMMQVIHILLEAALDLDIIEKVPPLPDPEIPEPTFSRLELAAQLAALAKVPAHDQPFFLTFAEIGQRSGELRAFRVMDFDRARPSLKIRRHYSARQIRPGRKGRTAEHEVPISRGLADLLCRMLDSRSPVPHPESPLFVTRRGVPYDERYTDIWRRACKAAGVPYLNPYNAFKHTLGYQMRLTGASRTDIQAWFGHRTAKSTDRYFQDDVSVLERVRGMVLEARKPGANQHQSPNRRKRSQ